MTPQTLVNAYLRRDLSQDARMAAIILRDLPQFVVDGRSDETVESYLCRIGAGTIRRETVLKLEGELNGSRLISSLEGEERFTLAARLETFARRLGA